MEDHSYTYNQQEGRSRYRFALASLICGVIALLLFCTGLFPIALGALSILFALLSGRTGEPMDNMAKVGILLSAAGIVIGLALLVYSVRTVLNDPASLEQFSRIYRQLYGEDFPNALQWFQNGGSENLPTA